MIALLPGGLELAYDESGRGVPLLLIHGWPHNRTLWAGQMSGLPTQARCIAPDLRGFGDSSITGPYSIAQFADDLAALLDSLQIDKVVACGLSMGGYITLALLRHHRARLRGLILTGTRAVADTPDASEKRARLIEFVATHGVEALAGAQLAGMLSRGTLESRAGVREALRDIMRSAPQEGAIGGQRAMMARPDASDLLATVDVPALVVAGAEDVLTPPQDQRALAAAIPGCKFELLAGAGHACAFERPAAFNHVLTEFLGELRYD
ncbi:MAG: alpha/beta hydrolase [Gemmatimonadota bacterium]|nr:alpha/beta hydrolase [Gemmatimonadota bacterium]